MKLVLLEALSIRTPPSSNFVPGHPFALLPMNQESLKRQSGISRIVNATSQQEAEVLTHFREQFERNETGYYERQKNAVETEIIRDALARLPQFIEEFAEHPYGILTSTMSTSLKNRS